MSTLADFTDSTQMPCIREGHRGESVLALREALTRADPKYTPSTVASQYSFDAVVEGAVLEFQTDKGLEVDGVVGPNTWTALGLGGASCGGGGGSRSGGGGGSPSTALATSGSYAPFYKQNWFYWTVGGAALVGALALFLLPKKKKGTRSVAKKGRR